MASLEQEILALWDRLRAVREPGALTQARVISAEIVALAPRVQCLDTEDREQMVAWRLYGYVHAAGLAAAGDLQLDLDHAHAEIETALLDVLDDLRAGRVYHTISYMRLSELADRLTRLDPESPQRWYLDRLCSYAFRVRARALGADRPRPQRGVAPGGLAEQRARTMPPPIRRIDRNRGFER